MPPRKTTKTYRKYNTGTKWNKTAQKKSTTSANYYPVNSPKFKTAKYECQMRIGSYRNVYSQFSAGTQTVFSPTAANKWTKYINSGNLVYKFNNAQFTRYFGAQWNTFSPTVAKQWMQKKFGSGIKDVIKGKGNSWLVATTKTINGRPFNNYNWK